MYLSTFVRSFIYLLTLISVVHCAVAPLPTPPPSALLPRAGCNEDNCLRALRNHISSASSFCNTYTAATQTATTGFPTYVPTTCGPTRVSSACSCAVTKPCATNAPTQVVQLPGFEMDAANYDQTPTGSLGPWNFTDTASRSFFLAGEGYEGNHTFHVWGWDGGQGVNGVSTVFQNITMCPSSQYRLSFYVGYADSTFAANATVAAYLDDVMIVPTQRTCSSATPCNLPSYHGPSDSDVGFRLVTAPELVTPPASGIGVLKVVISRFSTAPGNPQLQDSFVDYVTLVKVS